MPCEIYKKGKGHRVLVCPECGIIARNPGFLGKVLKRTGKAVLGEIPGASAVMEGIGLVKDLKGSQKSSSESRSQKIVTDSLDKPNKGERYVKLALGR